MLRIIAGIIVGWIVMAVLVMATFGITMLALGWDNTLQPGSYWTIIGGAVCALIARNAKAAFVLAAIVLVLGIGSAVMNMNKPDPPARTGEVTFEDIAMHGKEPTWFAFSKVVIGAAGLLIGSSLVSRKDAARMQSNE